jgi:hypothetical protein
MLWRMTVGASSTRPARARELLAIVKASEWLMARLTDAVAIDAPDWWIGAGAVRDLVWDERFGTGFAPGKVKDVDVAFFDAADLTAERDEQVEAALGKRSPGVRWDAKNQARVHLWYADRFGVAVEPLRSTLDGIATWPEFATCVAVRLSESGELSVAAPHGLDDLLDGTWRRNPARVTSEEYRWRLRRKQPERRWPGVTVLTDA